MKAPQFRKRRTISKHRIPGNKLKLPIFTSVENTLSVNGCVSEVDYSSLTAKKIFGKKIPKRQVEAFFTSLFQTIYSSGPAGLVTLGTLLLKNPQSTAVGIALIAVGALAGISASATFKEINESRKKMADIEVNRLYENKLQDIVDHAKRNTLFGGKTTHIAIDPINQKIFFLTKESAAVLRATKGAKIVRRLGK